jgi:hypothetical protein
MTISIYSHDKKLKYLSDRNLCQAVCHYYDTISLSLIDA